MTKQFISPVDPAEPSIQHLRFSPSQLDVWDRCHKKGYYVYRQGYRGTINSPAMRKGTVIHKALELKYRDKWTLIELMENMETVFPLYEDQVALQSIIGTLYRYEAYYAIRDDNFTTLAVESSLCVPFITPEGRTVYLNGIIDLIGETSDGKLFVMDHKSTSRGFWTKDSVWFDRQLHIYAAMLYLMGYDPEIGVINNINTGLNPKTNAAHSLFARVTAEISVSKLQRYLTDIGHRIDQILSYTTFPRNLNKSCGECQFKDACALALEGVDETDFLESNFRDVVQAEGFELVYTKE